MIQCYKGAKKQTQNSTSNYDVYPNLTKSQNNPNTFIVEIYLHKMYNTVGRCFRNYNRRKKAPYIENLYDHVGYHKFSYLVLQKIMRGQYPSHPNYLIVTLDMLQRPGCNYPYCKIYCTFMLQHVYWEQQPPRWDASYMCFCFCLFTATDPFSLNFGTSNICKW